MKRSMIPLVLVLALLFSSLAVAQKNVYGGTGKVRFKLNRAGSVSLYDADFVTQLSRASIVIGLDSAHVFDYEQDAMYLTTSPILSTTGKADTVATALSDNTYNSPPLLPDVQVLQNVYAVKTDPFVIVDFEVKNTASKAADLYIGLGGVPYPSETWGGETVAYDATAKIAYFYREGEPVYIGVKLLGQDPASFHALPWDVYSPADPSNDAATDSTRWLMTAQSGFDAPVTGDVDGSFFNLNFGKTTLSARASANYTVAILYSSTLAGLRTACDSAAVRFAAISGASNVKTVYGGTGAVQFGLNRAGSLSLWDKFGVEQLSRASMVVALDSANVFDYEGDGNYVMRAAALSTGGLADTVAAVISDNSWNDPPYPPNVRLWQTVRAYKDDAFVLSDYVITNTDPVATTVSVGVGLVPYPSETWGGETDAYDATKKMAYFFREGEPVYIGVKILGQDAVSFHALPWDVYSPADPSNDAATDSTRWLMTTAPGFDAPVLGDVDGSFCSLNLGQATIDAWSSTSYTVAYMYATSLDNLRKACDAAVARFTGVNGVVTQSSTVPDRPSLDQNYPNPFNPATSIGFHLATAGHVKMAVYDLLGREVATLVNADMNPGEHTVRWNAAGVSSGVYFYRLTAGSFTQTKQMVLMK
jgi:hypothetical protein